MSIVKSMATEVDAACKALAVIEANALALKQSGAKKLPPPPKQRAAVVEVEYWYCHCCGRKNEVSLQKNEVSLQKCLTCGRDESYALAGLPMPLHGRGGMLFRPSQVSKVSFLAIARVRIQIYIVFSLSEHLTHNSMKNL